MGEAGPIPDDLLKAARRLKAELNSPENMLRSIEHIARALLAERNRATERCAEIADAIADREDVGAIDAGSDDLTPIYRRGERVAQEIAAAVRKGD